MLTRRRWGGVRLTCSPLIQISPEDGAAKPPIRLSVVDLPQPDGPSRQKNSPSLISRSIGCSAVLRSVGLGNSHEFDRRRIDTGVAYVVGHVDHRHRRNPGAAALGTFPVTSPPRKLRDIVPRRTAPVDNFWQTAHRLVRCHQSTLYRPLARRKSRLSCCCSAAHRGGSDSSGKMSCSTTSQPE